MAAAGLYDPQFEHDACGVGFVADLSGRGGHDVVAKALRVLCNLEHRGAQGGDPGTGDGAGILTQIPDEFFRASCGFELPEAGAYAAGMAFFSAERHLVTPALARLAAAEGLTILGWREVPFDITACGDGARAVLPDVLQMFVAGAEGQRGLELERMAFCLRKRAEREAGVYFASLSGRTIVYKGMLSAPQLGPFYPDLSDLRFGSALALVHSRFSTNTFPSWPLAHPYRYVAHNGEINTVRGNRNWMRAREAMLASDLIPESRDGRGIERLFPVLDADGSDSASFDECLELLHMGGRSLPHAVLMMIPEPWENHEEMTPERRAFYQFHAALMEPWDGPALIAFTDGSVIGAVLDRNGLRPGRYWVTSDGLVVLASEVGVLDIDPATVIRKGRLQPGRVFLADTVAGRIIQDEEVKAALAAEHPYENWLHAGLIHLDDLPDRPRVARGDRQSPCAGGVPGGVAPPGAGTAGRPPGENTDLVTLQRTHGYTEEELRVILAPMARTGAEPIGSMGTDTPVAVLSDRPRLVFDYFTQLFAQVTNPPLDAIREDLVTSLGTITGPEQNLLEPIPASCRQIVLPYPVIADNDLAKIVHINDEGNLPGFASHVVDGRYDPRGGGGGLRARLAVICAEVSAAIEAGARLIILSDRDRLQVAPGGDLSPPRGVWGAGEPPHEQGGSGGDRSPRDNTVSIPSLLLTGAVHHHLIKQKSRTQAGLVVEAGDVRECHHVALLIGYGAAAVNPYLAIESVRDLVRRGAIEDPKLTEKKAEANLLKALGKGLLKIMSKMGVSTVASYTGAQIFEALGLGPEVIETCFAGTTSRLSGVGFDELAEEIRRRASHAAGGPGLAFRRLEGGGEYQWRRDGEPHLFSPEAVFKLQHATRSRRYEIFKEYTTLVDDQSRRLMTLRGLLRIRGVDPEGEAGEPEDAPRPVRVDDVEPAASIVRRFATGAMSYGSISAE
ncbi:MAG: glutamate synthase central domain-containing protein, partial [Streptosporangiaceae bacterium]